MLLFSCKIGQKYKQPDITDMPQTFGYQASDQENISDIGWGTLYQDSILQNLISEALENNKDVLIATARIKEMIANKRISFANIFPEIGGEILVERELENYGGDNKSISPEIHGKLTFGWEADIWGKLRWANDAGVAAYMQSVEARQALKLTIISEVAQSYFELMALDRELEIVRQTLNARKEGVKFAKLRYEGGLTSEIPYRQSLVELARTETLIPSLENKIKLKENDIAVLAGKFPSAARTARGYDLIEQKITDSLPIDLPASLLQRRPDVLEAEQRLIEKNANVGVALTNMLPSIKITGNLGFENSELPNIFESPTWLISGLLTTPIFNMGKNKAAHSAAKASYEQEVYNYEKTLLNVFKEVDNTIITFRKTKEMRQSNEALYNSANSYHELAKIQYINGITSYLEVLDAQRQLFDAEIALNSSILDELSSLVSLYKALGGGLHK